MLKQVRSNGSPLILQYIDETTVWENDEEKGPLGNPRGAGCVNLFYKYH